jgi:hypothetical protein
VIVSYPAEPGAHVEFFRFALDVQWFVNVIKIQVIGLNDYEVPFCGNVPRKEQIVMPSINSHPIDIAFNCTHEC